MSCDGDDVKKYWLFAHDWEATIAWFEYMSPVKHACGDVTVTSVGVQIKKFATELMH